MITQFILFNISFYHHLASRSLAHTKQYQFMTMCIIATLI